MTVRPETWDRDSLTATGRTADNNAPAQPRDPRFGRFTWLDQVHGAAVVTVRHPGDHRGAIADAAVTGVCGATLVIRTADCAPILFEGSEPVDQNPVLGVAHGGWKGLNDGVVRETTKAMEAIGARQIRAWLGPCIGVECYEFGIGPLSTMVERFGPAVRGVTQSDTPALNIVEVVSAAVQEAGITYAGRLPGWTCTACDFARRYSHRARKDAGRMALIAEICHADVVATRGGD